MSSSSSDSSRSSTSTSWSSSTAKAIASSISSSKTIASITTRPYLIWKIIFSNIGSKFIGFSLLHFLLNFVFNHLRFKATCDSHVWRIILPDFYSDKNWEALKTKNARKFHNFIAPARIMWTILNLGNIWRPPPLGPKLGKDLKWRHFWDRCTPSDPC